MTSEVGSCELEQIVVLTSECSGPIINLSNSNMNMTLSFFVELGELVKTERESCN